MEGLNFDSGQKLWVHKIYVKSAGSNGAGDGGCWHQHGCWAGAPRWNAGCGLAPEEPNSETPERGIYLGRSTRVTEHKVFQERQALGGSGHFFFFFYPSIFNVNAKVQNRASFSKMYFSLISWSRSQGTGLLQSRAISLPGGGTSCGRLLWEAGPEDELHSEITVKPLLKSSWSFSAL